MTILKRTIGLLGMLFLLVLGSAVASSAADPPAETGQRRDTLLYVKTVPPGAKVLLDGKEIGTSDDIFHVAPGVGVVHVELNGHKPSEKQVTIRADGVTRVELLLKSEEKNEKSDETPPDNRQSTGTSLPGTGKASGTRATADAVVEGVGWRAFRVGATREELVKAYGPPDTNPNPQSQWVQWTQKHHVDCLIDNQRGAFEVRFNKGFQLALTSGVKIGSSEKEVLSAYGAPDRVVNQPQSKMLEFDTRGILMWVKDGKVFDFTVFKPQTVIGEPANKESIPVSEPLPADNGFLTKQLRDAKAGNYWAKYALWAAYHKGTGGVQKNPEKAKKWLAELVKGVYLAKFRPVKPFAPKTPQEFLANFSKHSSLRSGSTSIGGASFFRTTAKDGVLIGSFLTEYPDKMRRDVAANPSLELLSIEELTPEMFVRYEASTQESLNEEEEEAATNDDDAGELAEEGWNLWVQVRMAEAAAKFKKAVELDPKNENAWNGLGWANFNLGKHEEARTAFRNLLKLDPEYPAALNGMGQSLLAERKYAEAEACLLKAALKAYVPKAYPEAPAARYGLARLYLLQGKFEQAEKYAQMLEDSGQGDDGTRRMLKAAKEKYLSEGLRIIIEPQPEKTHDQPTSK